MMVGNPIKVAKIKIANLNGKLKSVEPCTSKNLFLYGTPTRIYFCSIGALKAV